MTLDITKFWQAEFDEHDSTAAQTRRLLGPAFATLLETAARAIRGGNKILFFGNGGSAADAQHLATELAVRYVHARDPIAAIALTTDTSALTAIGNDYGFEYLFARQVEALGREGDVAIAISTSGNSPNVIRGIEACRAKGITVAGFTGKTGGKMAPLCDILVNVPSTTTARIQEMHITIGQLFCGALELELGLVDKQPASYTAAA